MFKKHFPRFAIASFTSLLCAGLAPAGMAGTVFVDDSATGANDGTSWSNAFVDVQAALAAALPGDDIWVAQGVYLPTASLAQNISFDLINGVAMYGGFAGTESSLKDRANLFDTTVLTGDLLGDDGPGLFENTDDNAAHVLVANGCGPNTILDGFTITGGNDLGGQGGGALRIIGGAPTIRSCRFEANQVKDDPTFNLGGAIYSEFANPSLASCSFVRNRVFHPNALDFNNTCAGGAVFLNGGGASFDKCRFETNSATGPYDAWGGAVAVQGPGALLSLKDCAFIGNEALACCVGPPANYPYSWGGAVANGLGDKSQLLAVGCRFIGNVSEASDISHGGAIHWSGIATATTSQITNCTFSGNRGGVPLDFHYGRAISGSSLNISNCTIANNSGGHNSYDVDIIVGTLTNSIVWGNNLSIKGTITTSHSCIQGPLVAGPGNINTHPQFTDPSGADGIFGTEDDDLHLAASSPCIDAGDNSGVTADALDVDDDGDFLEPTPLDGDLTVRLWDDVSSADTGSGTAPIVDMGALEFRGEHCQQDLGFQGPGNITLNICGDDLTTTGSSAALQVAHAPPSAVVLLFAGLANAPTPIPTTSGLLVPFPPIAGFPVLLPTDGNGNLTLTIAGSGNPPITAYLQVLAQNGAVVEFSNAIELIVGG